MIDVRGLSPEVVAVIEAAVAIHAHSRLESESKHRKRIVMHKADANRLDAALRALRSPDTETACKGCGVVDNFAADPVDGQLVCRSCGRAR